MDALCGLFDAVAGVGELLARSNEKQEELSRLVSMVSSISQSVRAFGAALPPQDRDAVVFSNQVFPDLARQLKLCNEVISEHRQDDPARQQPLEDREAAAGAPAPPGGTAARSQPIVEALRRGAQSGSRLFREGLEAVGGRLGDAAGLLWLPEDRLAVLRQASAELARLVPMLNLAIQAHALKREKRCASVAWAPLSRPLKSAKSTDSADAGAGPPTPASQGCPPRLHMQLVSDGESEGPEGLLALTELELRRVSVNSSSSLESGAGSGAGGPGDPARRVFGRQELREKVPKNFTLPMQNGDRPQPLSRFISRDLFILELPPAEPEPPAVLDSLDQATLAFGPGDEDSATLTLGGGPLPERPAEVPVLASVIGLSSGGLHLRKAGRTEWMWAAKDAVTEVQGGDCLALLLESPPGSCVPGPPRHLKADEARCLLGLQFESQQA